MRSSHRIQNRAGFPPTELAKYRGQWIAFDGDCTHILAAADDIAQVEEKLLVQGISPNTVWLERVAGDEDDCLLGGQEFQ